MADVTVNVSELTFYAHNIVFNEGGGPIVGVHLPVTLQNGDRLIIPNVREFFGALGTFCTGKVFMSSLWYNNAATGDLEYLTYHPERTFEKDNYKMIIGNSTIYQGVYRARQITNFYYKGEVVLCNRSMSVPYPGPIELCPPIIIFTSDNKIVTTLSIQDFGFGVSFIKEDRPGYYDGDIPTALYVTPIANTNPTRNFSSSNIKLVDVDNGDFPIPEVYSDPFSPGGTSEPGGGTGDFDGTSDPIDFPDMPELTSLYTGFIKIFVPTHQQLIDLADFMWTDSLFDLDTWKKIFANPMDAILGLSIIPVAIPTLGSYNVSVGNIPTGVIMDSATSQYIEVDCGTLNVNEYWGAYLDYEPFTKAEIYLPYIGTHAIAVDDIMGKAVHVKYHIDIISGACAAYIKCDDSVLYTFIGQCASSIPISGNDWTNVINGVISAATSIGSMVATGGASAPLAVPALANTAVNGMKPNIEKSGGMSGTGGLLGIQTPYLILTRPRQCLPAAQNEYMGYPSFISSALGDLTGYTEVEQIHLDGIAATDAEISEIENLLKSGVIF